jgi:hypothetical protein
MGRHIREAYNNQILAEVVQRYGIANDRVVDRIAELDEGALTRYIGGHCDCQAAKAKRGDGDLSDGDFMVKYITRVEWAFSHHAR